MRNVRRLVGHAALLVAVLTLSENVSGATAVNVENEVATLAGDGSAGLRDGAAGQARFLLPVGIAADSHNAIFVADQDAQRIRLVQNGLVSTVAGSGALERDGLSVQPGYRDGPALQAKFNMPAGIAIGPDGALYIADSGNSCVRKLLHGVVSTIVGKPGESQGRDGDARSGRLLDPRALAFDRAGNLYIADHGVGLRLFDRRGRLSSVRISDTRLLGVSVDISDNQEIVFASSPAYVMAYRPKDGREDIVHLEGRGDAGPIGNPGALAALDHRQLLFTDIRSSAVRYLRFGASPYVNGPFSRIIGGGHHEYGADNAGFADGSREASRFFLPAGITIRRNVAFISDTGNRRIRRLTLPRFRLSEVGTADNMPVDGQHYEVVYIGASSSYFDVIGDDSICALIELNLNRSHRSKYPVRCHQIRMDGGNLDAIHDYLVNFVAPRGVDLVLVQMSTTEINTLDKTGTMHPPELAELGRKSVQSIIDALKPTRTRLGLIWVYAGPQISASEYFTGHAYNPAANNLPVDEYAWHADQPTLYKASLKSLDILQYDEYSDILAYERSKDARPLFLTIGDVHPNWRRSVLLGREIAKYLLSLPATTWVPPGKR